MVIRASLAHTVPCPPESVTICNPKLRRAERSNGLFRSREREFAGVSPDREQAFAATKPQGLRIHPSIVG